MHGMRHSTHKRFRGVVLEDAADFYLSASPDRVDMEKGIIYDVLVIGTQSKNTHGVAGVTKGTRYAKKLHESLVDQLEGIRCNYGHTRKKGEIPDGCGALKGLKIVPEGVAAKEVHVLKSHPQFNRIMESAARGLNVYQLSINGLGVGVVRDGWWEVDEMPVVKSVDFVDRGGATGRLNVQERDEVSTMDVLTYLTTKVGPKLTAKQRKVLAAVMEEGPVADVAAGTDMENPAEETDLSPTEQLREAFASMCWDIITDESLDAAGVLDKLKPILENRDAVLAGTEQVAKDAAVEESAGLEAKIEKLLAKHLAPVVNQRKEADAADKKAARVGQICESLNFKPNAEQLAELNKLPIDSVAGMATLLRGKSTRSVAGNVGGSGTPGLAEARPGEVAKFFNNTN